MSDWLIIIGAIEAEKTRLCIMATEMGLSAICPLIENYTQSIEDIIIQHSRAKESEGE